MVETQSLTPTDRRIARRSVTTLRRVQNVNSVLVLGAALGIWFGGSIGSVVGWSILGLAFASGMVLVRRQARQFVTENQEAIDAMNRGDLATAQEIWDFWSGLSKYKRIMVFSCHNLAWIWMLQGRFDEAKKLYLENNNFELRTLQRVGLAKTGAADLALLYALLGELSDAEKWLAIAGHRNRPPQAPNGPPMVILARTVIRLRQGLVEDATKVLDEGWDLCESRLASSSMRTMRVLRAFARSTSGPRDAGMAYADIAAVRPRYPGEHTYLGLQWPEMAAFLAANELA